MNNWKPPEPLRLGKKTKNTGIGRKKDPSKESEPIKAVSKKQRKRTDKLHGTFELVLKAQREFYGEEHNFCQAGAGEWRDRCPNNKKGKQYPLVPDHVFTRNGKNVDRPSNLQPLCNWCNFQKGSRRIDFRPSEFVEVLKKLDDIWRN